MFNRYVEKKKNMLQVIVWFPSEILRTVDIDDNVINVWTKTVTSYWTPVWFPPESPSIFNVVDLFKNLKQLKLFYILKV